MKFNQLKLLIRADAGPRVGTGHVMRMIALGQSWLRSAAGQGGSVAFVGGELPGGLIRKIKAESFEYHRLDNHQSDSADAIETGGFAHALSADWIALDGYSFGDSYQQCLRTQVPSQTRLLVVDDYQHASHQVVDAILNQNVYADRAYYAGKPPSIILAGSAYGLLRSEFAGELAADSIAFQRSTTSPPAKRIPQAARRVLVTFGGADVDNWTLAILETLAELGNSRLVVDAVVGACNPHLPTLEQFKSSSSLNLRLHQNVDRMSSLMARTDLAITAGGSTCYELARCGVPAIVIPIANNQIAVAQAMDALGVMKQIAPPSLPIPLTAAEPATTEHAASPNAIRHTIAVEIKRLLADPIRRQTMSDRGTLLVDGRGGERVVEHLNGLALRLRNATSDDAELLWQWRNDPEVRSVSFQSLPIPWPDHLNWIRERVAEQALPLRGFDDDQSTLLWMCEAAGEVVGQVRFDKLSNDPSTALISIVVDQANRGRGLGKALITKACRQFFEVSHCDQVTAQIKPGNVASEKAFRAVGFAPIEPAVVQQSIALQYRVTRAHVCGIQPELLPSQRGYRKSA